jgi:DNA segregation ATPase FtsK/SpoIIIE, S-DNA-T family
VSWFKKIFQKFQQDSDDPIPFPQNKESRRNRIDSEGTKQIQSKVSYQYPKGSFRFPVIPDHFDPISKIEKKPLGNSSTPSNPKVIMRNSELKETKNGTHEKRVQQVSSPTTKRKEQSLISKNKSTLSTNQEREVRKPEKRSSGPFRPTVIPSPIFGYERPNQTNVIEYELTGFYQEKKQIERSNIEESIKVETESTVMEPLEFTEQTFDDFQEELIIVPEETTVEIDLEIVEYSTTHEQEEVDVIFTEESLEPEPDVHDEQKVELEPEVHEEQKVEPETSSSQRTHLPFNVLMLKQDRLKLEQKKLRETIGKRQVVISQEETSGPKIVVEPTVSPQPIHVPIEPPLVHEAYQFPDFSLLMPPVIQEENGEWLQEQEELLNQTLINFNVGAKVVNVTQGPAVTRFEVQPDPGVKVNKITNLTDDIKLSLAAKDIRIEAPIPGKHTIGIEVPNQASRPVLISEILNSPQFCNDPSPLTAALGLDISGKPVVTDLRKMPHGLIAGATGSGKSVCINTMLVSLLYKANPQDVKLLLIDPKMVELAPYNHIPHLVSPVITDVKAATAALKWAVDEMERRYELFAHTGVREITRFNELAEGARRFSDKLPFIIIVIDELADLMMVSPTDVEEAICRIAQKARACGIHLVVATQRPSVDVITGLIKANIPTRIAFSVSSQVDSRTIIDMSGAEKLLGKGDMLFLENGTSKPVRLQGTYISDQEIDRVVEHVRKQGDPEYLFEQAELLKKAQVIEEEDELFYEACEFVVDQGGASTSSLQRRFKIGYNRAARLIDLMEGQGYISEARGSKPRDVLISEADLGTIQETGTIS